MGYLTLNEAAKYATNKKGFNVEPSVLLRAGVYGVLIIVAPFPFGTMYNATESKEEDFKAGLLIIPPSHLLEIEAEGFTTVEAAFSSDGNHAMYFPRQERTLGQLCILITDLDKFIINLIDTTPAQAEPVADVAVGFYAGTEPKDKEVTAWLRETWINEGKLGGTDFFIKLKKYVKQTGSPIVEHYSAGKDAGFRWETSSGATGKMAKKTISNKVSIFNNKP